MVGKVVPIRYHKLWDLYLTFQARHETFGSGCAASTHEGVAQSEMRIACAAAAESPLITRLITRNIGELFERQECEMSLQDPAGCEVS